MAYLPKFIPLSAFICLSFYLFTCFLSFCPSLVWLSFVSPCLSSCFLVGLCVFFFPYGLYAKRKGAPCWCVLSCPVVGLICKITTRAVRLYICDTVFLCEFATIAKIHKIRDVYELSYSVKSELLCFAPELLYCFHCFDILVVVLSFSLSVL